MSADDALRSAVVTAESAEFLSEDLRRVWLKDQHEEFIKLALHEVADAPSGDRALAWAAQVQLWCVFNDVVRLKGWPRPIAAMMPEEIVAEIVTMDSLGRLPQPMCWAGRMPKSSPTFFPTPCPEMGTELLETTEVPGTPEGDITYTRWCTRHIKMIAGDDILSDDSWIDRLNAAAALPCEREPGCTCGPRLGDWNEGCSLHAMDDDDVVERTAMNAVISDHDRKCLARASEEAIRHGLYEPFAIRSAAAQILADGEIRCDCGGRR